MTVPTAPNDAQDTDAARRHWTRIALILLGGTTLMVVGIIVLTACLLVTETGSKMVLSVVESATNIQFRGVTGNLAQRLHVQSVTVLNKDIELNIEGLDFQWQPSALLRRQIKLDYLRLNRVEMALAAGDGKPAQLPESLQLPALIREVDAQQLVVRTLIVADLESAHQHLRAQHYSALQGSLSFGSARYGLKVSGSTSWGDAKLQGTLGAIAPFNLQAQVNWSGNPVVENGITLPKASINGILSGNISRAQIQAQVAASDLVAAKQQGAVRGPRKNVQPAAPMTGGVSAVLTPFSVLPVDTMHLDFASVNPSSFSKDAPSADLQIKADLKLTGSADPVLNGQVAVRNARAATWNSGGIPIVAIGTELYLSKHRIVWRKTSIQLEQNGSVTGAGELTLAAQDNNAGAKQPAPLPILSTQFELANVNLLLIDSRLKKTRLSGLVQAQNKKQQLDFSLKLQDANPALSAQLDAELSLTPDYLVNVHSIALTSRDATLNASGYVGLHDRQVFSITGNAHNFNPARWIDVPDGHIATSFQFSGQLDQRWQVAAQLSELSGQFAGMELHGAADFNAQQERLLTINKLDLLWGKSHLSANGTWQLGTQSEQNDGARHDQLQFALDVPELAALSKPFEKIEPLALQGALSMHGVVTGSAAQPSGHLSVKSNQLAIPNLVYLDSLQGEFSLAEGAAGKFEGTLSISNIAHSISSVARDDRFRIESLQATLLGQRHAHTLSVNAVLPQGQQVNLAAQGDLQDAHTDGGDTLQWSGKISALNLSGPIAFQLREPFDLQASSQSAQIGQADWSGQLGALHVQQINWQHGQLKTSGQFRDIPVVKALKLWRNNLPISGKLLLDAAWQFDVGQQVNGQLQIQRSSGDLNLQDASNGHIQSIALGLQALLFKLAVGQTESTTPFSHQQIQTSLQLRGDQLGLVDIQASSALNQTAQGWELPHSAPLNGHAVLQIKDIAWMSQLLGAGVSLRGVLDAQATLDGSLDHPDYQARINGQDLQISLPDIGVLLPNGKLVATINGSQFNLESLRFSETIKNPPKHEGLIDLPWVGQTGFVESSGSVDLQTLRGAINTTWEKFPFLQSPDAWMVASGQAQLAESESSWNLTGKLSADAAYFSVPKQAAPKLSSDVVVLKKNDRRSGEKTDGLQSSLDFTVGTGKNFIFVGRGIDTRLDGDLRIRSKNGGAILATGSIQTVGGNYEGYGQQLAIDRGILNFQGPIDNPGLNVRAIRHGLPVEAGVEVVGTVARPEVHLISEPNVPDPDKLSWLVLGRSSDQMAGSEAALLMSAAGAIFGSDDGGSVPSSIAHSLGLSDLSFGTTSTAPESQLPTQTVAGTITSTSAAPTDQVFSVGKRIAPDLIFSIERSLTDASNGLKLTWQLTRRFSIIGRAGSDTAIDGQYTFSFD